MRMTTHHLLVHVSRNIIDGKQARVSGNLALQNHLKQNIAQLLPQVSHIAGFDGVDGFVSLFNHVVRDGSVRLLAVPRASVRRAQCRNRGHKLIERCMIDGITRPSKRFRLFPVFHIRLLAKLRRPPIYDPHNIIHKSRPNPSSCAARGTQLMPVVESDTLDDGFAVLMPIIRAAR